MVLIGKHAIITTDFPDVLKIWYKIVRIEWQFNFIIFINISWFLPPLQIRTWELESSRINEISV